MKTSKTPDTIVKSPAIKHTPTLASEFQAAYDFFNARLFNSELPDCIIVLCNNNKRTLGYYHKGQYVETTSGTRLDKISLNPQWFIERGIRCTLSTLVHEMCHLWAYNFLTPPPRAGYHCRRWGAKMKEVGLYPSTTGEEGGKEVGQSCSHYIIKGGPFDLACEDFLRESPGLTYIHSIQFETGYTPLKVADYAKENSNLEEAFSTVSPYASGSVKTNKSNRIKYSCPNCKTNVWGKEGLSLRCGACESPFIIAD